MNPGRRTPVIIRLAAKIGAPEINVPELGPCWPFAGGRTPKGYGVIRDDKGQLAYAHRISLAAALGRPLRPGMLACHRCDYKPCIRPFHLYEGTKQDNELDKFGDPVDRWYVMREVRGDAIVFVVGGGEDARVANHRGLAVPQGRPESQPVPDQLGEVAG